MNLLRIIIIAAIVAIIGSFWNAPIGLLFSFSIMIYTFIFIATMLSSPHYDDNIYTRSMHR